MKDIVYLGITGINQYGITVRGRKADAKICFDECAKIMPKKILFSIANVLRPEMSQN